MHLARVVALLVCISQAILSQVLYKVESPPTTSDESAIYPVPGCQALRDEEMKLRQYLEAHPELRTLKKSRRSAGWNFQLGDKHSWWATNLVPPQSEYSVPSTCRAVGANYCYVFVEDSLWISGRVNQAAVDSIVAAFESRTPANPQKGIYETDVQTFGDPPDFDNDPKIIILILDIKDGFSGSGGYVAGYFFNVNQFRDGQFPGRRSNEAEIYYVDGNPGNLISASGLAAATSTTAHEFQHMIHWNADKNEITFVNESCSEVASLVCGYSYTGQNRYTDGTDVYLLGWSGTLEDYSRAARWALYLWNQFPNDYLKLLVDNKGTGISGIDGALTNYLPSTSRRFSDVFVDWLIANSVNDLALNSRYGYTYLKPLSRAKGFTFLNPNVSAQNVTVSRLGADYLTFAAGSNLSITFNSSSSNIRVKAIRSGPGGKTVEDVPLNSAYPEPAFGSTYTTITFIVLNLSSGQDASYSYSATGAGGASVELRWDETEPQGLLRLTPLDTICVTFDAVAGAKLDSIRVALRRAGEVRGGVWRFTGTLRPTPLGSPLAVPISATTTETPPVVNPGATFPYPIPFPNWRTVDLRAYNISSDQSFAVGFWLESDTSNDARVMVTRYTSTDAYHSFTFLHNPSSGSPNWYYLSSGQGEIYLYLIRAYVSSPITGVKELLPLPPSALQLDRNYPNPFNPSTTIRYSIPLKGQVKLRIFDVVGRVVATLVDQEQPPGMYSVVWHGATDGGVTASSGVYFYRLEATGYHSAQKMVLLR